MPAFKPVVPQFGRPQSTMRVPAPVFQSEPLTAFDAVGADIPTLPAPPTAAATTNVAKSEVVPATVRQPFNALGGIGNLFGGMDGDPLGNGPMLDTPFRASLHDFHIPSEITNQPYRTPGSLDQYSRTTAAQRFAFVHLFKKIPELKAAILSKANAIAAAAFSIQPESWHRKEDRIAAQLCKYALKKCRGGSDGLVKAIVLGAFIQGASAVELRFRPGRVPGFGPATGVELAYRGLDLTWLGLELDPYRNVQGIVSFVRGLQTFAPDQVMWYTHEELFNDPFGTSDVYPLIDACNALIATNRLWDIAMEMYSSGYAVGTAGTSLRQEMLYNLQNLRSYGTAAIGEKDKIELLNLGASSAWQAFADRLEKIRERIYLAVRYAFLPFVSGDGGGKDQKGNTSIHASTSDVSVDLPARGVGRLIESSIFTRITEWNLNPVNGQPVGVPTFKVGGTDPEEAKKLADMVKSMSESGISMSRKWVSEEVGVPPPEDENDVFQSPEQKDKEDQKKQGQQPGQPQPGPAGKPALPATGTPQPTPAPSQQSPATPGTPPGTIPPAPPWFRDMVDQAIAVPLGA